MKRLFYLILLSSFSVYGQWITGFLGAQNGVLTPSQIPWSKYTHVIHFAAAPNSDATVDLHYLIPSEIAQVVASRPSGKHIMFCLKDNDNDLGAFPSATSPWNIATFVNNLVNFTNQYGYDGVDIDWEANVVPSQYEDLISRLRAAMPNKVITMDGGNWSNLWDVAATQASALDQINIMCYDLDGASSGLSWYDDALFQNGNPTLLTCDWRMRPFLTAGVPPSKIGIGMPFYGRRWFGVSQPTVQGYFNQTTIYYRDLAVDSARFQPQHQFYDSTYKANYLSIPEMNEFDSYAGPEHIHDAVAWQRSAGLGGFMTYTIDYEYINSRSGDAAVPLSTALANEVFGGAAPGGSSGPTSTGPAPAPQPVSGQGPVISNIQPAGTLPASATSATISFNTNVPSTCRYATIPGIPYDQLPAWFNDQGTTHSTFFFVSPGTSSQLFARCQDTAGNANTNDTTITINVAYQ